ncbi:MAG: 2OG-Fe(II) oxygenase [Pusillimonas sp.]|nr:2OG-Fe(II) oxygenase [Pusillimonas sp.]
MDTLPEGFFRNLETRGWACCDTLVTEPQRAGLLHVAQLFQERGLFHSAHIGHLATKMADPAIRGDQICWIDAYMHEAPIQDFLGLATELQNTLNATYFLGLRSHEFHFARYDPGFGYKKHLDQHRNNPHRKISVVLYLNEHWTMEDGGELCLYEPQHTPIENTTRLRPVPGRLVVFRSDLVWHEVLPGRKPRWSLTGWLRDDYLI